VLACQVERQLPCACVVFYSRTVLSGGAAFLPVRATTPVNLSCMQSTTRQPKIPSNFEILKSFISSTVNRIKDPLSLLAFSRRDLRN
jgi:hypothetical protein